jgi:DNA-binding transcriptional LysR family regulator
MSRIDRIFRSNLKLRHLQLLVALDELRHVGRVAEFLSVTQPAVSKTLQEIERALGARLFERSARGTRPTVLGESVVRFARGVIAEYERTRDELAAMASGAKGRACVGAMVVATPVLLARAIALLKTRSPGTTVYVEEGDLAALLPKLRIGELELVLGRLEPAHAAPDLQMEPLYEEPMVIVARPDHALAGRRALGWKDLAREPWVTPPPWASLRRKLDQTFARNGLEPPRDTIEAASFLATLTFLRERPALAFLAQSVALHFQKLGLVRILPIAFRQPIPPVGVIARRGRQLSASAGLLAGCIRQAARSLRHG